MNLRNQGRVADAEKWLQSLVAASPIDPDTRQLLAELSALNSMHAYAGQ